MTVRAKLQINVVVAQNVAAKKYNGCDRIGLVCHCLSIVKAKPLGSRTRIDEDTVVFQDDETSREGGATHQPIADFFLSYAKLIYKVDIQQAFCKKN